MWYNGRTLFKLEVLLMNLRNFLALSLAVFQTVSFVYAEGRAKPDRTKAGKPVVCAASKEYNVGDKGPSGGWIIYKKPAATGQSTDTCWQYLETAPADVEGSKVWSNVKDELVGGTSTGVGNGKENTQKIIAQAGHKDSAAKACDDFIAKFDGKTFDDWFLPSKDELELMYLTLKKKNLGNFKTDDWYWSSSEDYGGSAWGQLFSYGYQANDFKFHGSYVRCSRAF
jgi:hypothetical protein